MRKIIMILVCILLAVGLCACGSDKDQDTRQEEIKLEETGKNAPSEDLIMEDLKDALQSRNGYASLTGAETVKSLTEGGNYKITLAVTAETKYADWQYTADMFYTEYDQGWILDQISWSSETYEVVRFPDTNEMVTYASTYLLNHEVHTTASFADYMIPMQNAAVQVCHNENTGNPEIELCWDAIEQLKYTGKTWHFTSLWDYHTETDNWELAVDSDADARDLGYQIENTFVETTLLDLDYSGERPLLDLHGNQLSTMTISNFSWNEMDVYIPAYMNSTEHFTAAADVSGYDYAFENANGDHILFIVSKYDVFIYYYPSDNSVAASVEIKEELPLQ